MPLFSVQTQDMFSEKYFGGNLGECVNQQKTFPKCLLPGSLASIEVLTKLYFLSRN